MLAPFISVIIGCTETVPPAHLGKILNPDGYSPEVLTTGRHSVWGRDSLVLLDMSTNVNNQPIGVTMMDYDTDGKPRAGLEMGFVLSYKYRLKNDTKIINAMFNDIKVNADTGIDSAQILSLYGSAIITTATRDVLSKFTPEEALANRGVVNQKVGLEIVKRLESSPLDISNVVITKMQLPDLIKKRIATNKDRELKLAEEKALQAIEKEKRTNAIALARQDATRDLIIAKSAAKQNIELNKGLTPEVLRLRELRIQEMYAEAVKERMSVPQAGDTVFMPFAAVGETGANMRMFAK